jgi:sulfatase maturation enzyme AslB (radical SAM superfamily)
MVDVNILHTFADELQASLDNYKKRDGFSLDVTTTEKCNFRCDYCFEGNKRYHDRQYSLDDMKNTIYRIIEHPSFIKEFNSFTISFWGGEPTLAVDDILYYIDEFVTNPLINFFFYTNGTLQENLDAIVNRFKEYDSLDKLSIQISWDGDPIHDIHRISGTKAYNSDYVKSQIKRYQEMGVRVDVKSTITPKDFSKMPEVWKSFERLNETLPEQVTYTPTIDQTYYDNEYFDDFRESIAKICAYEYDYIKEHQKTLMSWFGQKLTTCSFCSKMCCVDVFGNVYPCHGFLYETEEIRKKECLGNIFDNKWIDTFFANRHKYVLKTAYICDGCTATSCISCCVQNSSRSDKETSYDRWFDKQPSGRCEYFKLFGIYDKALHRYIIMSNGEK